MKIKILNRRKDPDALLKTLTWLAVAGWLLMLVAFFLIDQAKPEFMTFFNRMAGVTVAPHWDQTLAVYILALMILGTLISIYGIIINTTRQKRKFDSYRFSLISLAVVSVLGIFYIYGKI
jgi:formate hydrogenlyase subunit 3/multisubunit Na+/H+ antiporter MnhD subunit